MAFSLQDLGSIPNAWGIIALLVQLVQQYQGLINRSSYLLLLLYWHVYISKAEDLNTYTTLLGEFIRSRQISGGERNPNGTHWTINVANYSALYLLSHLLAFLIPDRPWTTAIIAIVFSIFFLGHYLVQLWMQTRIAWLVKFNRDTWRWRSWAVDMILLSIRRKLDGPYAAWLVTAFWWTLHHFLSQLTLGVIERLSFTAIYWICLSGFDRNMKYLIRWPFRLFFYRLWFLDIAKFANPNPPNHKYAPLQDSEDIRIILLYPRLGFGRICCSLLQGPHMRLLFYETISYTWGSMDLTEEILIDGCTRKVTESVYEILASYSSICFPRLLWIDALCIDQSNDEEKSQQVPLMEKIYSSADFTTVFLGRSPLVDQQQVPGETDLPYRYDGILPPDDATKSHFKDCRLTFDLLKELDILSETALRHRNMEIYQWFEHLQLSPYKRRQWAAFMKMLQHPWFQRVWVVQEVALSQKVYVRYGDERLDWRTFAKGVERLREAKSLRLWLELEHRVHLQQVEESGSNNIKRIDAFREKCRPKGRSDDADFSTKVQTRYDSFGLTRVLESSGSFRSTDPRDRVYGLMSLCTDPVKVDYSSTAKDVYLNVAKQLVKNGAFNLLFSRAGLGHKETASEGIPDCPSWVPDWTIAPVTEALKDATSIYKASCRFRSGGDGKCAFEVNEDDALCSTGLLVDVIETVGPTLFPDARKTAHSTLDEARQLSVGYSHSLILVQCSRCTSDPYHFTESNPVTIPKSYQSLQEAFWNVLITGRTYIMSKHSVEFLQKFPSWERHLKTIEYKTDVELLNEKDSTLQVLNEMAEVTDTLRSTCRGRRVFVTRKGFMGLCSTGVARGDLVYVLPGFHVPLVLRLDIDQLCYPHPLRPNTAEKVRLVGECYVHGLMDGEALSMNSTEEKLEVL